MIDIGIYVALGFLGASLLALMLVPALWNRAVRLTSKKLESTMPMSVADIQADKDQLRAEYAIRLRRVEMALDKAKDKAIREQVEAKEIQLLSAELSRLREELERNRVHREENDALRQELNRLATQILAVAKGQGVDLTLFGEARPPLRGFRTLADTVASLSKNPEPLAPEPIFPYGDGTEREPEPELTPESAEPAQEQEVVATFVAVAEEIAVEVRLGEPAPETEAEFGEPSIEDGFEGSYAEGGHESGEAPPTNGEAHHDDEDDHEVEVAREDAREDEVAH